MHKSSTGSCTEWRISRPSPGGRQQRTAKNEDATDWNAFRQHLQALGAPDPGTRPPDDWVGEDYKQAHPDCDAQYRPS